MDENVAKAVDQVECSLQTTYGKESHALTEIADAVDPLVIRLGEVTTRLEAANALLRECVHFIDYGGAADDELAEKIDAHLSENGHD